MTASFYPQNWPTTPFHDGEIQTQARLGVQEHVNSFAPKFIRPFMPDQHREFFQAQPFIVVAARDWQGRLWSTLLFATDPQRPANGFISSPDPTVLSLQTQPLPGDALEDAFQVGSDLGLLGIEFATRRRNRVNGRITSNDGRTKMEFRVDQSFGNCAQYIRPREWWMANGINTSREQENDSTVHDNGSALRTTSDFSSRSDKLNPDQMARLSEATSVFLATGYRGRGEDPRFGNDSSHRGGTPGFLDVQRDGTRVVIPDYSGNDFYNTIGNIIMDSSMGMSIPLYETGGMIQITGTASIVWDGEEEVRQYPGAKRLISFEVGEVVELKSGSLPIRWSPGNSMLTLQIIGKVKESDDVTSFYLGAARGESPKLPSSKPGQHVPIALQLPTGTIERSYSISNFDTKNLSYRISVKREAFGFVSRLLHDDFQVGDLISAQQPSGNFNYEEKPDTDLVIFLSGGIGVTPVLSMLKAFVNKANPSMRAHWIHSTKSARHHPFKQEVADLIHTAGGRVKSTITCTKPESNDSTGAMTGRITPQLLGDIIKPNGRKVDVYMCGPTSFIGAMEAALVDIGVDSRNIQYETF